jgi:protein-S-isoprenylcysteine O-methyltransferase Ste14
MHSLKDIKKVMGCGPLVVIPSVLLTCVLVACILISNDIEFIKQLNYRDVLSHEYHKIIQIPFIKYDLIFNVEIGVIFIFKFIIANFILLKGMTLWYRAVFRSNIVKAVSEDVLLKTEVYAEVRNPIYSSFLLACTALLLIPNNLLSNLFIFVLYAYMSIVIKDTEEIVLINKFQNEYLDYMKNVRRLLPKFNSLW